MARITVEDCLGNIDNLFELVLVAAKRDLVLNLADIIREAGVPAGVFNCVTGSGSARRAPASVPSDRTCAK